MRSLAHALLAAILIGTPMRPGQAATSQTFLPEPLPPGPSPGPPTPQPVGPDTDPRPTGDPCAIDVVERNGIVSVGLDDPSRAGRQTTFVLDEITYAASFDGRGHLSADAPMFHAIADLDWTGASARECHRRGIAFSDFAGAAFWALVWPAGTIQLGLQVVEPEGRLGGPRGFVSPERPNLDLSAARGRLLRFGAPVAGTSEVELYTIPPDRNPHQGFVYPFVEFVSRGNPARPPFCGDEASATAVYKVMELADGQLGANRTGKFLSVPCGKTWPEGKIETEYLQRWKWGL